MIQQVFYKLSYQLLCQKVLLSHIYLLIVCDNICILVIFVEQLIGSPDDSSLGFLRSDNARRYVRQLPQYAKKDFSVGFPNMSAGAVDLLEKMLIFDPNRRITGILRLFSCTLALLLVWF